MKWYRSPLGMMLVAATALHLGLSCSLDAIKGLSNETSFGLSGLILMIGVALLSTSFLAPAEPH